MSRKLVAYFPLLGSRFGGMWPPPSSILSWKVVIRPARPSFLLPPPAAAGWAKLTKDFRPAAPEQNCWRAECSRAARARRSWQSGQGSWANELG